MKILLNLSLLVFLTIFSGCGSEEEEAAPAAAFIPAGTEATADATTGELLAQNLAGTASAATSFINAVDAHEGANAARVGFDLVSIALENIQTAETEVSLNAVTQIDLELNCTTSGSILMAGTLDDTTNAVDFTMTFNACDQGGVSMNGAIRFAGSMTDFANKVGSFTLTIPTTVTMAYATDSVSIASGTSIAVVNDGTDATLTQTIKVTYNSETYACDNVVWLRNNNSGDMYQESGRDYFNNLANYVDYDDAYDMSATPFTFDSNDLVNSGTIQYKFSNGAKIRITVTSSTTATVEIDSTGDGTFETSADVTITQ